MSEDKNREYFARPPHSFDNAAYVGSYRSSLRPSNSQYIPRLPVEQVLEPQYPPPEYTQPSSHFSSLKPKEPPRGALLCDPTSAPNSPPTELHPPLYWRSLPDPLAAAPTLFPPLVHYHLRQSVSDPDEDVLTRIVTHFPIVDPSTHAASENIPPIRTIQTLEYDDVEARPMPIKRFVQVPVGVPTVVPCHSTKPVANTQWAQRVGTGRHTGRARVKTVPETYYKDQVSQVNVQGVKTEWTYEEIEDWAVCVRAVKRQELVEVDVDQAVWDNGEKTGKKKSSRVGVVGVGAVGGGAVRINDGFGNVLPKKSGKGDSRSMKSQRGKELCAVIAQTVEKTRVPHNSVILEEWEIFDDNMDILLEISKREKREKKQQQREEREERRKKLEQEENDRLAREAAEKEDRRRRKELIRVEREQRRAVFARAEAEERQEKMDKIEKEKGRRGRGERDGGECALGGVNVNLRNMPKSSAIVTSKRQEETRSGQFKVSPCAAEYLRDADDNDSVDSNDDVTVADDVSFDNENELQEQDHPDSVVGSRYGDRTSQSVSDSVRAAVPSKSRSRQSKGHPQAESNQQSSCMSGIPANYPGFPNVPPAGPPNAYAPYTGVSAPVTIIVSPFTQSPYGPFPPFPQYPAQMYPNGHPPSNGSTPPASTLPYPYQASPYPYQASPYPYQAAPYPYSYPSPAPPHATSASSSPSPVSSTPIVAPAIVAPAIVTSGDVAVARQSAGNHGSATSRPAAVEPNTSSAPVVANAIGESSRKNSVVGSQIPVAVPDMTRHRSSSSVVAVNPRVSVEVKIPEALSKHVRHQSEQIPRPSSSKANSVRSERSALTGLVDVSLSQLPNSQTNVSAPASVSSRKSGIIAPILKNPIPESNPSSSRVSANYSDIYRDMHADYPPPAIDTRGDRKSKALSHSRTVSFDRAIPVTPVTPFTAPDLSSRGYSMDNSYTSAGDSLSAQLQTSATYPAVNIPVYGQDFRNSASSCVSGTENLTRSGDIASTASQINLGPQPSPQYTTPTMPPPNTVTQPLPDTATQPFHPSSLRESRSLDEAVGFTRSVTAPDALSLHSRVALAQYRLELLQLKNAAARALDVQDHSLTDSGVGETDVSDMWC